LCFFQAEDGIRDRNVTGVQTCALPIYPDKFYKNIGAKPGDVLILTKPIGAGILTTALKRGQLTADENEQMTHFLTTLNKYAAECLRNVHPHRSEERRVGKECRSQVATEQ